MGWTVSGVCASARLCQALGSHLGVACGGGIVSTVSEESAAALSVLFPVFAAGLEFLGFDACVGWFGQRRWRCYVLALTTGVQGCALQVVTSSHIVGMCAAVHVAHSPDSYVAACNLH